MDKWTELRETIQELHDNNPDKPDVVSTMHFLLNLMHVLDTKEKIPPYPCFNCCSPSERAACCGCPRERQWQEKYGKK